jgi:hypothetical protein
LERCQREHGDAGFRLYRREERKLDNSGHAGQLLPGWPVEFYSVSGRTIGIRARKNGVESVATIIPNHRKTDNRHWSLLIVASQSWHLHSSSRSSTNGVATWFDTLAPGRRFYKVFGP